MDPPSSSSSSDRPVLRQRPSGSPLPLSLDDIQQQLQFATESLDKDISSSSATDTTAAATGGNDASVNGSELMPKASSRPLQDPPTLQLAEPPAQSSTQPPPSQPQDNLFSMEDAEFGADDGWGVDSPSSFSSSKKEEVVDDFSWPDEDESPVVTTASTPAAASVSNPERITTPTPTSEQQSSETQCTTTESATAPSTGFQEQLSVPSELQFPADSAIPSVTIESSAATASMWGVSNQDLDYGEPTSTPQHDSASNSASMSGIPSSPFEESSSQPNTQQSEANANKSEDALWQWDSPATLQGSETSKDSGTVHAATFQDTHTHSHESMPGLTERTIDAESEASTRIESQPHEPSSGFSTPDLGKLSISGEHTSGAAKYSSDQSAQQILHSEISAQDEVGQQQADFGGDTPEYAQYNQQNEFFGDDSRTYGEEQYDLSYSGYQTRHSQSEPYATYQTKEPSGETQAFEHQFDQHQELTSDRTADTPRDKQSSEDIVSESHDEHHALDEVDQQASVLSSGFSSCDTFSTVSVDKQTESYAREETTGSATAFEQCSYQENPTSDPFSVGAAPAHEPFEGEGFGRDPFNCNTSASESSPFASTTQGSYPEAMIGEHNQVSDPYGGEQDAVSSVGAVAGWDDDGRSCDAQSLTNTITSSSEVDDRTSEQGYAFDTASQHLEGLTEEVKEGDFQGASEPYDPNESSEQTVTSQFITYGKQSEASSGLFAGNDLTGGSGGNETESGEIGFGDAAQQLTVNESSLSSHSAVDTAGGSDAAPSSSPFGNTSAGAFSFDDSAATAACPASTDCAKPKDEEPMPCQTTTEPKGGMRGLFGGSGVAPSSLQFGHATDKPPSATSPACTSAPENDNSGMFDGTDPVPSSSPFESSSPCATFGFEGTPPNASEVMAEPRSDSSALFGGSEAAPSSSPFANAPSSAFGFSESSSVPARPPSPRGAIKAEEPITSSSNAESEYIPSASSLFGSSDDKSDPFGAFGGGSAQPVAKENELPTSDAGDIFGSAPAISGFGSSTSFGGSYGQPIEYYNTSVAPHSSPFAQEPVQDASSFFQDQPNSFGASPFDPSAQYGQQNAASGFGAPRATPQSAEQVFGGSGSRRSDSFASSGRTPTANASGFAQSPQPVNAFSSQQQRQEVQHPATPSYQQQTHSYSAQSSYPDQVAGPPQPAANDYFGQQQSSAMSNAYASPSNQQSQDSYHQSSPFDHHPSQNADAFFGRTLQQQPLHQLEQSPANAFGNTPQQPFNQPQKSPPNAIGIVSTPQNNPPGARATSFGSTPNQPFDQSQKSQANAFGMASTPQDYPPAADANAFGGTPQQTFHQSQKSPAAVFGMPSAKNHPCAADAYRSPQQPAHPASFEPKQKPSFGAPGASPVQTPASPAFGGSESTQQQAMTGTEQRGQAHGGQETQYSQQPQQQPEQAFGAGCSDDPSSFFSQHPSQSVFGYPPEAAPSASASSAFGESFSKSPPLQGAANSDFFSQSPPAASFGHGGHAASGDADAYFGSGYDQQRAGSSQPGGAFEQPSKSTVKQTPTPHQSPQYQPPAHQQQAPQPKIFKPQHSYQEQQSVQQPYHHYHHHQQQHQPPQQIFQPKATPQPLQPKASPQGYEQDTAPQRYQQQPYQHPHAYQQPDTSFASKPAPGRTPSALQENTSLQHSVSYTPSDSTTFEVPGASMGYGVPAAHPAPKFQTKSSSFSSSKEQSAAHSMGPMQTPAKQKYRDPTVSPPTCLVAFGFGGNVVTMFPKRKLRLSSANVRSPRGFMQQPAQESAAGELRKGPVNIYRMDQLHPADRFYEEMNKFPGPLSENSTEDDIVQYIETRCNQMDPAVVSDEDDRILLQLLKVMIKNNGKLVADASTAGSGDNAPDSQLVELLRESDQRRRSSGHPPPNFPPPRPFVSGMHPDQATQVTTKIRDLLFAGDRKGAAEIALQAQMWPEAMLISYFADKEEYKRVVSTFINGHYGVGDPLRALYLMFADQQEHSVQEPQKLLHQSHDQSSSPPSALLDSWVSHARILAANRTHETSKVLLELGDRLWKEARSVVAAHVCYLLAGVHLEAPSPQSRMALLGADHRTPEEARFYVSPAAVQRTEIYEWIHKKGSAQGGNMMIAFQGYKLIYAMLLADFGKLETSFKYVNSMLTAIKAITSTMKPGSSMYLEGMQNQLTVLDDRLRQHLGQARVDSVASSTKSTKWGLGSALSIMGKIVNRVVEGSEADLTAGAPGSSSGNKPQPLFPGAPRSNNSHTAATPPGSQGSAYGGGAPLSSRGSYSNFANSPAAMSPVGAPSLQQPHIVGPGGSPARGPPAPVPFMSPKAAAASSAPTSNTAQMDSFAAPPRPSRGIHGSMSDLNSTDEGQEERRASTFGRSASEAPDQATTSSSLSEAKETAAKPHSKTPPPSQPKSSSGSGWFSGLSSFIATKMNPDAKVAKLGEQMEAYFDEEKKRWVFPGEDAKDEPTMPSAPPTGPIPSSTASDGNGPPGSGPPSNAPGSAPPSMAGSDASANDPLAALMAPPASRAHAQLMNKDPLAAMMAPPSRPMSGGLQRGGSMRRPPRPQFAVFKPAPSPAPDAPQSDQ